MCLLVNKALFPHRYVAVECMDVYKVIRSDDTSAYRHFQYEPHRVYEVRSMKTEKSNVLYFEHTEEFDVVRSGFHSYWAYDRALNDITGFGSMKPTKFTIPPGAHFYIGMDQDVVSDMIVSGNLRDIRL